MKINITIKDDKALRSHIKDMVKGQAMSFTRKEIRAMVLKELKKVIKGKEELYFEKLLGEEIQNIVREEMRGYHFRDEMVKIIKTEVAPSIVVQKLRAFGLTELGLKEVVGKVIREKILSIVAGLTGEEEFGGIVIRKGKGEFKP